MVQGHKMECTLVAGNGCKINPIYFEKAGTLIFAWLENNIA